jgi:hypothetical protein
MSIENLNSAVRAAGFAMATSDEPAEQPAKPLESESWTAGEAMLLTEDERAAKSAPSIADRLKGVLGLLGRSAPA